MASQSPKDMFMSIPPITRAYLTAGLLTTTAVALRMVSSYKLLLLWPQIFGSFQVWRLATNFIYFGPFSLGFAFQLYFLTQYSQRLEQNPFPSGGGSREGTVADYAYMFLFGGAVQLVIAYFIGLVSLSACMVFMVIYVWSRRNPDTPMSFFGFRFSGMYMPWILIAFHVLIGADIVNDVVGVVSGHLYYFIQEVLPNSDTALKNYRLLQTPEFLNQLFDVSTVPRPTGAAAGHGYDWGRGRTLG